MDLKLRNNSQLNFKDFYFTNYLKSSASGYIDTGVPAANASIIIEFEFVQTTTGSPYGAWYNRYNVSSLALVRYSNNYDYFYFYTGNTQSGRFSILPNVKYHIEHSGSRRLVINMDSDTTLLDETNVISGITTNSIYIFAVHASGGVTYQSPIILYRCEIYNNGVLARNYVPAFYDNKYCLYDRVTGQFHFFNGTSELDGGECLGGFDYNLRTMYIKDCPNIPAITFLRHSPNIERVRCDVNNEPGSVAELLRYEALAGFTDDYQEQQAARMTGTFILNNWYTSEELNNIQGAIDGLTVVGDNIHNVDTALENNDFAVQTIDSTKPNYNPAAAIILYSNGFGNITTIPLTEGGGRYVLSKTEAAQISSILATAFSTKTTVTDIDKIVSNDATETYNFSNFNEFDYFTGASGFSFASCTNLQELIIPKATSTSIISKAGNQQNGSTLRIKGNLTSGSKDNYMYFKKYIIDGNFVLNGNNTTFVRYGSLTVLRIGGNITHSNTPYSVLYGSATACAFMEVMGSISFKIANANTTAPVNLHLGYSNIAGTIDVCVASYTRLSKIYVGDGTSKAADQAVFDLYNADTNWATYCGSGVPGDGKVDLWWNYNGEYKWYYITDSLTNCTNTNPDAWPHITRGESYETTIVADEGMTLDSVTVEMLDTDTTSPTYDTMVDITSSVYDSSTGEINIPSVTGNVVITASAS